MYGSVWIFVASLLSQLGDCKLLSFDFQHGTCHSNTHSHGLGSETPPPSTADVFLGTPFFSGYINIARNGGEMFYWYFPVQGQRAGNALEAPVILWLTGGPGCSSEFAALTENGPLTVEDDATVTKNPLSWVDVADIIFVDQPLGTGFSSAGDPRNYVTNEDQVAVDLRDFLVGLLEVYPRLSERPFYLAGESYAGHYIPAVAYKLHNDPIKNLDLKGIAIGNGWVDPVNQYPAYAQYAFEHNLLTQVGYQLAKKALEVCIKLIDKAPWPVALAQCSATVTGILGKKNPYDVRLDCDTPPTCYNSTGLDVFLNRKDVQMQLGVHREWVECNPVVYTLLLGDWITETRTKIGILLDEGYRVLIYNGDQDFICNWRGSDKWTKAIHWKKEEEFSKKELENWHVKGHLAGQIRRVDNLIFLRVLDAGHMVPMDQPAVALEMMEEFMNNRLSANHKPPKVTTTLSMLFAALKEKRRAVDPSKSLTGGMMATVE